MAPPHFLDETAYAKCKYRFDRSDAQHEGNRTYSLWFAAHLKTTDHHFNETNTTHLFGATYLGVKYNTTMVDASGSFLNGPASLVASFYMARYMLQLPCGTSPAYMWCPQGGQEHSPPPQFTGTTNTPIGFR